MVIVAEPKCASAASLPANHHERLCLDGVSSGGGSMYEHEKALSARQLGYAVGLVAVVAAVIWRFISR